MVQIREILANKQNYGGVRSKIEYIVIHYTANDGDSAKNNGNYFKNNVVKASAHYFVDDNEIVRSVPDNHIAWSVGGTNYGGRLYGVATNKNTLNIELCDTLKNGTIAPTKETIQSAIDLVRAKMREYRIPWENVIRHYDVTKKCCPAYWVNDERWKAEFWNLIPSNTSIEYTPITPQERSVYRLYNKNAGEHFFTANVEEGNNLLSLGWSYEGIAWKFPEGADTPVYRLYNPYAGNHFFTTNDTERVILANHGWIDEGIAFYSGGANSVFRLYNDGFHMFTAEERERDALKVLGWKSEGTAWNCE